MEKNRPAVAKRVAVAYKVSEEDFVQSKQQSDDYDDLIFQIKSSFDASESFTERKQLLTLLPKSWSRQKMVEEMNCSDFLAKEAMRLRNEVGILPNLQPKQSHKKLQELDVATIIKFNEDNSKTSPAMKDVVMISIFGKRIPKSKMLIMDSIKELYARFKEEHPTIQIGLAKFYSFRPRWCVTSQSSNTLNVCVCVHHQNPKLMLAALDPSLKYREMLAKLVCSLDCKNCMYYQVNSGINRCSQCPDSSD